MTGAPTSASTGSPHGAPLLETVTPRFVWFIALFAGPDRPGELPKARTETPPAQKSAGQTRMLPTTPGRKTGRTESRDGAGWPEVFDGPTHRWPRCPTTQTWNAAPMAQARYEGNTRHTQGGPERKTTQSAAPSYENALAPQGCRPDDEVLARPTRRTDPGECPRFDNAPKAGRRFAATQRDAWNVRPETRGPSPSRAQDDGRSPGSGEH
jgi:hypothetical protein